MSVLRTGLIGLGMMGRHHARVMRSVEGTELVAVAGGSVVVCWSSPAVGEAARSSPAVGSGTSMGAVEPIRMASMRGAAATAAAAATGGKSSSKVTRA